MINKLGKHNIFAHLFLVALLFVVNVIVFHGDGTFSVLLGVTAETTGTLLATGDDYSADADRLFALIPKIVGFIIDFIIYYLIAAVIIGISKLFSRKKENPQIK